MNNILEILLNIIFRKYVSVSHSLYNKYFETSWNNIKNTSEGIISLIPFKTISKE